jgi:hypothetical protein
MPALSLRRKLSRADVRSISYIELLLIVVFAVLLTLAGLQEELTGARTDLADYRNRIESERKSRLVAVDQLKAEQKKLLDQTVRLKQKIVELREISKLLEEAKSRGRDLASDVRLLWKFEPVISGLKRSLDQTTGNDLKSIIEAAIKQIEDQKQHIAALRRATSSTLQESVQQITELEQQLKEADRRLAARNDSSSREIDDLRNANRVLTNQIAALEKEIKAASKKPGTGRGRPACWVEGKDRIFTLLTIRVLDDGFKITRRWTEPYTTRVENNQAIMNLLNALDANNFINIAGFKKYASAINSGNKDNCVFHALSIDETRTLKKFETNNNLVLRYFYRGS